MPIAPTYPGVYIEEVPSGVRTITGVATSIAAFVDRFERGPRDVAVRVTSFADFERIFGGLDPGSAASYGIQQFFLNGGSDAYVVRTVAAQPLAKSATAAALTLRSGATGVLHVSAGLQIHGESVENPGAWGNGLRFEIDHDTVQLPNSAIDPDNVLKQEELFNLTISEVEVRDGRTTVVQTETYRNLTLHEGARTNALSVVNAASRLVQLDREGLPDLPAPPTPAPRPDATGTVGVKAPGPIPAANAPFKFKMDIDPVGTGGAAVVSVPATLAYTVTIESFVALRPVVEAAIRAAANDPAATDQVRPLLAGATVQFTNGAFRVLLGRGGPQFNPNATIAFQAPGANPLGLSQAAVVPRAQMLSPTTKGDDGDDPGAQDLIGTEAAKSGMHSLDDVSLFNILCIPAAAELDDADDAWTVYSSATIYCEQRRAFLLIDVPEDTDDPDAMQTWLTENATLRHKNAAVYFPRVEVPDPLDQNRLRSRGASGTMAGVFAATDVARGVWKAPAGTEARLRNVQDLDYVLTDRENGILNPLGANCLRSFPVFGNVSWGARTLDGADQQASEWKYVPVRRLALFLEESLYRGTQWVVFEPNDEPLWSQIRLNVGAFMQALFRQGAFQGQTPREAYLVKCDRETTTKADINLGIVNIVVGFAPLKPAEFVIIKIQQLAGQIPT